MRVVRDGRTKSILDVYEFTVDINAAGDTVHIWLDRYYRLLKKKLLAGAPRWGRNDKSFSTIDYIKVPDDVVAEVLTRLKQSVTFHLPKEKTDNNF